MSIRPSRAHFRRPVSDIASEMQILAAGGIMEMRFAFWSLKIERAQHAVLSPRRQPASCQP